MVEVCGSGNIEMANNDDLMTQRVFKASVPAAMELPESMKESIAEVFNGLYDAPYYGEGLTILDIGAHVGAFTLWANMRWPGSQIYAYEPHPQTFASLQRNVSPITGVHCVRAAVYPSKEEEVLFYSRFGGDGEAGVVEVVRPIFTALPEQRTFMVPVLDPFHLPAADIVKIDTEGTEVAILEAMELEPVSLILLQYHFGKDRERIKEILQPRFMLEYETAVEWRPLIAGSVYRTSLVNDYYGQMCFVNPAHGRLRHVVVETEIPVAQADNTPNSATIASNSYAPSQRVKSPVVVNKGQTEAGPVSDETLSLTYFYDLLATMVMRDMKLRYKRSVLGIAWSLLNPLAQLLVFSFVFRFVLPLNIPNYTAFLFVGILAWTWFQGTLQQATGSIVENGALIGYPGFPIAVLPVVTVTSHLVHFLLALPIVVVFLLAGGIPLTGLVVLLPLIILIQFVLSLSIAFFVATLQVSFRDTQYLLGIALMLGFFLTPIFYELTAIPARYQRMLHLNPMHVLIEAYRDILVRASAPDLVSLLILGSLSLILLATGYRLFSRASYRFVEQI